MVLPLNTLGFLCPEEFDHIQSRLQLFSVGCSRIAQTVGHGGSAVAVQVDTETAKKLADE